MKRIVFVAVGFFLINMAQAGVMDGPSNPHLHKNDIIVGGKLAFVGVYGAGVGFVINGEYGLKEGFLSIPNFPTSLGVGASLGYSSYSDNYPFWGEYTYRNILILGNALYHVKLIKKIPMDTYLIINLGINIGTSSYDGSYAGAPDYDNTDSGITFGTGVGARYYFTNKLSAVGELGFGMGVIRLGVDFKLN
jgi:hypothetical protein